MIWLILSIFGVGAFATGLGSSRASESPAAEQASAVTSDESANSDPSTMADDDMDESDNHSMSDDDNMYDTHDHSMSDDDDMEDTHDHSMSDDDDMDDSHDHSISDDDDMDDSHDHGSSTPLPETAEEIAAFVEAIISAADVHVHDAESSLMGEHMALLDLVSKDEATHIAIGNGSWFDPDNWHNGEVPGDDAKVLISDGVTMEYDAESDARIFTIRVDGELNFATDQNTKMVVDTFVVSPTGTLTIGSEMDPVDDDVTAEIVIANNGAIDVDWDPTLLSRGLISHGEVSIHGQIKDSHEKVIENPMAGDTSITFDELPVGWEVGDTIVIAGTDFEGHYWDGELNENVFHESEDEVRVISDIQGGTVFFETQLEYDHDSPRSDLFTSVANYSRNVKIGTEDPDSAEVYERGHVMFMHSDDVDVRYAEFNELGRTDKSEDAVDADEVDQIAFDTNVKGRYGLHLHRTGTEDLDDPAIVVGNSVFGSPGWGFVHHDSNAILDNNASFNTFGAGFVAESGNETGVWSDNIAILSEGNGSAGPKGQADTLEFDTARSGDGFWLQSRLIEVTDNIAASVNHGFVYYHRGPLEDDAQLVFDADSFAIPEALFFEEENAPNNAPILTFEDNEVFASGEGLHVVKANPNQHHDVHSELEGFTAWNVVSGVHLQYTAHYLLKDFDIIGANPEDLHHAQDTGIELHNNTADITIVNASITNFETGIDFQKLWTSSFADATDEDHAFVVVDTEITNVDTIFGNYDPDLDLVTTSDALDGGTPQLTLDGPLSFDNEVGLLRITGTKTDGIGEIDFPSGAESYSLRRPEIEGLLEGKGFHTTTDGDHVVIHDIYFSDRLTGDIYKQPTVINLENIKFDDLASTRYADAKDNGLITSEELDEIEQSGPTKVVLISLSETIETEDLYNLTVHDSWDAYYALTNGQDTLSEDAPTDTTDEESHDHLLDV